MRLAGLPMYSSPQSASGQSATFFVRISNWFGGSVLNLTVETKTFAAAGWGAAGAFAPIGADGNYVLYVPGLLEQVRISMNFSGAGGASTDGCFIEIFEPSWSAY